MLMDPALADAEIYAKQCDILLLALVGLVVVQSGRWTKARYSPDDENFALAANRLQKLCPINFEALRKEVPHDKEDGLPCIINQEAADTVCHALANLLAGKPVQIDVLPDVFTGANVILTQLRDIPPTQPPAAVATPSPKIAPVRPVLTQVDMQNPEGSDSEQPPAKKLREQDITPEELRTHQDAIKKMIGWVMKQKRPCLQMWRLNEKAKNVSAAEEPWKRAATVSKLLCAGGLAQKTADKSVLQLLKPPVDEIEDICRQIADTISIDKDSEIKQMQDQMGKRNLESETWSAEAFKSMLRLCGEGFN